MPSYDPEFQDAAKSPPEYYDPTPKRNGCWFYGCVFAIVALVIVLLGLAVGAFVLYRTWAHYVEYYTADAPIPLPKVEATEEQRKSAVDRASKFRDALKTKVQTEPLVLTGDDLNALIQESPKLKDHVYLTITGDKVKARVSLPLDDFFDNNSLTRGRFFNGEAELKATIQNGKLKLEVDSIDVAGKPLPEAVRAFFAQPNIVLDLDKENEQGDLFREIASLEIKDGKVVITSRSSAPAPSPAEPAPAPSPAEPPAPPEAPKPAPAAVP